MPGMKKPPGLTPPAVFLWPEQTGGADQFIGEEVFFQQLVGVADQLKGQVAIAFAVAKDASGLDDPAVRLRLEGEVMRVVEQSIGAVGRPARVYFVSLLPKTRSGKLLRRAIQAVCEGRDPGDLTTMDDPSALQQIKDLVAPA